ncbi:MAG TPA: glycosyltransferase family 4 protein [Candidatus Paceibacterota bacterium]
MEILMLSTDKKFFQAGSEAQRRLVDYYGKAARAVHVVVFTSRYENYRKTFYGNVTVYPTRSFLKFLGVFDYCVIGLRIIQSASSKSDFLITTQDPFLTGLAGFFLKKKFKLNLLVQIHTDFLSPYFRSESLLNLLFSKLGVFLVKRADYLRAVSERIKSSVINEVQVPEDQVATLSVFVDVKAIRDARPRLNLHSKYPNRDFIILMASRITKEKNFNLAISAIASLTKKHPSILLLIVGSGPEIFNLKSRIASLKLENNVIIESWNNDLNSYYKTADAFLLNSNYEGYGRTIIEAFAAGLPVLMTDVGCAGWIAKNNENAVIFPVGDFEALSKELEVLIKNKALRSNLSRRALQSVADFGTSDQYLKSFQNLFKNAYERNS